MQHPVTFRRLRPQSHVRMRKEVMASPDKRDRDCNSVMGSTISLPGSLGGAQMHKAASSDNLLIRK